jgi:hypothetical protein
VRRPTSYRDGDPRLVHLPSFMEPMIAGAAGGEIDATIARIQGRFVKTG